MRCCVLSNVADILHIYYTRVSSLPSVCARADWDLPEASLAQLRLIEQQSNAAFFKAILRVLCLPMHWSERRMFRRGQSNAICVAHTFASSQMLQCHQKDNYHGQLEHGPSVRRMVLVQTACWAAYASISLDPFIRQLCRKVGSSASGGELAHLKQLRCCQLHGTT